jgi:hypothetical protein
MRFAISRLSLGAGGSTEGYSPYSSANTIGSIASKGVPLNANGVSVRLTARTARSVSKSSTSYALFPTISIVDRLPSDPNRKAT